MTIWIISDTHFGHANMLKFTNADGLRVRPEFETVEEMDEAMVDRWNKTVRPGDHVLHLGDVAMRRPDLQIVKRLHGQMSLVFGNHDIYRVSSYQEVGFKKFYGCRVLNNIIFTHIPIHPGSLARFYGNAHGHIHAQPSPPGAYFNACVEQNHYTPVSLEEVAENLKWRHLYEEAA